MTGMIFSLFVLLCFRRLTKSQSTVPTAAVPQQTQPGVVVILASEITADIVWNPPQLFGSDVCGGGTGCAGSWWVQTAPQAKSGSIHGTVGENTSMGFFFTGTSVSVFGRTLNNGANGHAIVDEGTVVGFPTQSVDGGVHEQQLLWSSSLLDGSKRHFLEVAFDPTFFGATVNNRSWLQIDYFQYTFDQNANTSTPPSPSSTGLTTTALSTNLSGSGSSSTAAPLTSQSTFKHSVPVGAIAGGVIGGLTVVMAGIVAIFLILRRKTGPQDDLSDPRPWHGNIEDESALQNAPVPFVMSTASSSGPGTSSRSALRLPIREKGLRIQPSETVFSQVEASRVVSASIASPDTPMPSIIGSDSVIASPPAYTESPMRT